MKIPLHKLTPHLNKAHLPIYLITGEEPLLKQEAVDEIKQSLRKIGVDTFMSYPVTAQTDPGLLQSQDQNLSLFADKQCLLLDCSNGFAAKIGQILLSLTQTIHEDCFYIIHGPKLTPAQTRSKWYQHLDKIGGHIAIWPIETNQYLQWLQQRAKQHGLSLNPDALQLLAQHTEGNLLAASQALQKLALSGQSAIDKKMMSDELINHSQYDVFQLTQSILLRQYQRITTITKILQKSQTEPTLIVWALSREFRLLATLHEQHQIPIAQRFKQHGIWPKRQPEIQQGLAHYPHAQCLAKLQQLSELDKISKGVVAGDFWQTLLAAMLKTQ